MQALNSMAVTLSDHVYVKCEHIPNEYWSLSFTFCVIDSYLLSHILQVFVGLTNCVCVENNFTLHYANTPMQYTAIFHGCKNVNFQMKMFNIFLFLLKTLIVGTR